MTWLIPALWLVVLMFAPAAGGAAEPGVFAGDTWNLPLLKVQAQSPLEAQMLDDKPLQSPLSPLWPGGPMLSAPPLGITPDPEGGATIRLPRDLELRISFLYDGDQAASQTQRPIQSHLLLRYTMDYRPLPNLRVGMSGFFYQPLGEDLLSQRRFGERLMGWGPGLQYDLGRWSFTLKSQLETSHRGEGLQNWFRVWYAF